MSEHSGERAAANLRIDPQRDANLRIDPQRDAIRAVLREADVTWMPSQSRALFERIWDIVGGRTAPPAEQADR